MILLTLALAWIFAELISGIFHWWEDRYGNPNWPIIGKTIIQQNILHHKNPYAFCKDTYWSRNGSILIVSAVILSVAIYFNIWFMILGSLWLSQSNEIHAATHRRNNRIVRFLQKIGVMQSHKQHAIHHKRPFDKYYCVLTNYMNPILSKIKFWDRLENVVFLLTRIRPLKTRAEA